MDHRTHFLSFHVLAEQEWEDVVSVSAAPQNQQYYHRVGNYFVQRTTKFYLFLVLFEARVNL